MIIHKILHRLQYGMLRRKIRPFREAPQLTGLKGLTAGAVAEQSEHISRFYKQYVGEVSRADMAASLELSASLLTVCLLRKPVKVLDLGSGFSSFIFRRFALSYPQCAVWSVDDDAQWLRKTGEYLQQNHLPVDNLLTLDEFIQSGENEFDIILLDLNYVEVRKNYIRLCIERCKSGGLIVFDDVHKPEFMYELLAQTQVAPLQFYDLKPVTEDEYKRYALLAVKQF